MKNWIDMRKNIVFMAFLIAWAFCLQAQNSQTPETVSAKTFKQWQTDLSNWGRWGDDDQLGTLNLITAEKRTKAAALVKDGKSVSLAMPMDKTENMNNGDPLVHELGSSPKWAGDTYTINYHGYAHSHIDAICHIASEGKLYNGYPIEGRKPEGAESLGIEQMANGIFTRGLLVDIPWVKGVDYLEPGTPIMTEDLEAWERKAGVKVENGDVLLIRTGRWECERQKGMWKISDKSAGLHASTAKWLRDRGVSVLGSDCASDVFPSGVEGETHPIHLLVLHSMGMPILDNLNLEDLAIQAQSAERWEFLFVGVPLRIEGGTGSPMNPIAVY